MYVIRVYACVVVMMLCMSCGTPEADRESALEDSYALLDAEIARSGVYEKEKEDRIGRLRLQCAGEDDEQLRTDIINSLIDEFAAYKSDSALYYINLNLRRPEILSKPGEYPRLRAHPRKTASEVPRRAARTHPHRMPKSPLSGIRLEKVCLETIWRPMARTVS